MRPFAPIRNALTLSLLAAPPVACAAGLLAPMSALAAPAADAPADAASAPADAAGTPPSAGAFMLAYTEHALANGLKILLARDPATPVVSVAVYYRVGSVDEPRGATGFAHLFEHMMFQGTKNVAKSQHFKLVQDNGGAVNGTTNADYTNYYETVPSDKLALALWLEADRMRSLEITDAAFENQRETVKEERRMRVDNQPYVPGFLRLNELAYTDFAYAHPIIGYMEDLDRATAADARAFFDTWYVPSNAVLVVAGDFEPEATLALIDAYFGDMPAGAPPQRVVPKELTSLTRRGEVIQDANAALPAVALSWHAPPNPEPSSYALQLAADVLASGKSSRLYARLVKGEELVVSVGADLDGRRGTDLFNLWAICKGDPDRVRSILLEELQKLEKSGPTERELQKVKNRWRASYLGSMERTVHRAMMLGQATAVFDDPSLVNREVELVMAVTADDVRKAVRGYLGPENFATVTIVPAAKADAGAKKGEPAAKKTEPGAKKGEPAAKKTDAKHAK